MECIYMGLSISFIDGFNFGPSMAFPSFSSFPLKNGKITLQNYGHSLVQVCGLIMPTHALQKSQPCHYRQCWDLHPMGSTLERSACPRWRAFLGLLTALCPLQEAWWCFPTEVLVSSHAKNCRIQQHERTLPHCSLPALQFGLITDASAPSEHGS